MLHSRAVPFAVVLVFLGACGDTGILVDVTRDPLTTPARIDQLFFHIGTGQDDRFVEDAEPLPMVTVSANRDLLTEPYTLLLRSASASAEVMVAVVAYVDGAPIAAAAFDAPKRFAADKVLRWQLTLSSNFSVDRSLDCVIVNGVQIASTNDQDCDGSPAAEDCDDLDPNVHPGRGEVCGNKIDDNCNGQIDEIVDLDGDGFTNCAGDCDDANPAVHPGAAEVCDGLDNDCSGDCDEPFDADNDLHTTCGSKRKGDGRCEPPLQSEGLYDCDDDDPEIHWEAVEVCDGLDNNCNRQCDEGLDRDGDGATECGSIGDGSCGQVAADCAPDDPNRAPTLVERCDGIDNDCDPTTTYAPSAGCYLYSSGCYTGTRLCDDKVGGSGWGDCALDTNSVHVPDAFCDAYASCDAADVVDPLECADTMATAVLPALTMSCQLRYDIDESNGCEPYAAVLPSVGTSGCYYSVLTYPSGSAYTIGVSASPTGTPARQSTSCTSYLRVADVTSPSGSGPVSVVLGAYSASDPGRLIEVTISVTDAEECDDGAGLQCKTL
jgi:hypothetical protein